jgi:hypothetical protein
VDNLLQPSAKVERAFALLDHHRGSNLLTQTLHIGNQDHPGEGAALLRPLYGVLGDSPVGSSDHALNRAAAHATEEKDENGFRFYSAHLS